MTDTIVKGLKFNVQDLEIKAELATENNIVLLLDAIKILGDLLSVPVRPQPLEAIVKTGSSQSEEASELIKKISKD